MDETLDGTTPTLERRGKGATGAPGRRMLALFMPPDRMRHGSERVIPFKQLT